MKDRACARCDWRPDPDAGVPDRDQAMAHAEAAGHWLCSVCTRSLDPTEPVVCERCITRTRSRLAQLVELYALLPDELEHPSAQAALVLLGPGSVGNVSRYGEGFEAETPERWWVLGGHGPLTLAEYQSVERTRYGKEHLVDNRECGPPAVVWMLTSWADAWRESWGEDPPGGPPTVVGAAGYLERRARRAANGEHEHEPHPAFADFVVELAELIDQVEATGHRDNHPELAPVACFGCRQTKSLRRVYRTADPCEHERPAFPPAVVVDADGQPVLVHNDKGKQVPIPVPLDERRARHEEALKQWRDEHARCDQGGLSAQWVCRVCDRVYTDEQYMLAVVEDRASVAGSRAWGTPWEVAASLGVAVPTVRRWAERLQVTSVCSVDTRRIHVWWPDARAQADEMERRAALRAARAAAKRAADSSHTGAG